MFKPSFIRKALHRGFVMPRKNLPHNRFISQTASLYTGGKFYQSLGIFFAGYSLYSLRSLEKKKRRRKQEILEDELLSHPLGTFTHPLESSSWFYQIYLSVSRYMYLAILFTPVTFLFLLSRITGSDSIYQLSLNSLENALCYSGCGFQKFAQWMSMRPDKFHQDLIQVAERFKEDAPTHTFEETKQTFQENFGKDLDDVFEWFDDSPIASGTIAQVYRAKLREEYAIDPDDTREVAVKIRHKQVLQQSWTDPGIILNFCELSFALLAACMPFDRTDFCHSLTRQIDFQREGYNMCKFRKNFKDDDTVIFPEIYTQFSSDEVIVETFVRGNPVSDMMKGFNQDTYGYDYESEKANGYSDKYRSKLADNICKLGVNMYLRDNFAHADLHSGNLMATDDGKLIVLDTGIVSDIGEEAIDKFHSLLESSFINDSKTFVDLLIDLNVRKGDHFDLDREGLERDIDEKFITFAPDGVMNFGSFYGSVLHSVEKYKMELRGDVAASIVNMGVMEGMIKSLDADYDLSQRVIPFFLKKKSQKLSGSWNTENQSLACF